ncbi:DUF3658 domain-containing protein [Paenibacillus aurantiacus]|uniref:DUF3658 domain-containing protein n=1 Tax=Paenibacillus aurantiacus TaxID=1936118 RepID=A0ABV5KTI9_9BACL
MTERESIMSQTRAFVKAALEHDSSGHDWWHIVRVARSAKLLAEIEGGEAYVCELAALLHDIADEKLNVSKEAGLRRVEDWLAEAGVDVNTAEHVMLIISTMSYGGGGGALMETLEGRIVQDADRLDAIGAIAAARTFVYSGWKGRLICDPNVRPRVTMTKEEYRSGKDTAVNHFYEKLLKLKALLNTESARMLAEERHVYMVRYLEAFDREWELGNSEYLAERLGQTQEPERIHVVFDASAASSLRYLFREASSEYVVLLADDLSVGPLDDSGAPPGTLQRRLAWMSERGMLGNSKAEYFRDGVEWRSWPQRLADRRVVVWAAGNAREQIGLRRLTAHIPESADVRVIDAPSRIFERTNGAILHTHTGEVPLGELGDLVEQGQALTTEQQSEYAADWQRLIREAGELRVIVEGRIQSVPEDYWDEMILQAAISVASTKGRMYTAASLVGQFIGLSDQRLNDSFLFARVRHLVERGKLHGGGNPEAIGGYNVGFGEPSPSDAELPDPASIQAYMEWARQYATEAGEIERLLSAERDADEQVLSMLRALSDGCQADARMRRMVAKVIDDFMNERQIYAERRNAVIGMLSAMQRTGSTDEDRQA